MIYPVKENDCAFENHPNSEIEISTEAAFSVVVCGGGDLKILILFVFRFVVSLIELQTTD